MVTEEQRVIEHLRRLLGEAPDGAWHTSLFAAAIVGYIERGKGYDEVTDGVRSRYGEEALQRFERDEVQEFVRALCECGLTISVPEYAHGYFDYPVPLPLPKE